MAKKRDMHDYLANTMNQPELEVTFADSWLKFNPELKDKKLSNMEWKKYKDEFMEDSGKNRNDRAKPNLHLVPRVYMEDEIEDYGFKKFLNAECKHGNKNSDCEECVE